MEMEHLIPMFERLGSFALLTIIVVFVLIKYLPSGLTSFLNKIDKINEDNNKTQKEMQNAYNDSINRIVDAHKTELARIADRFEKSVENSTNWHQKHSQDLAEIKSEFKNLISSRKSI